MDTADVYHIPFNTLCYDLVMDKIITKSLHAQTSKDFPLSLSLSWLPFLFLIMQYVYGRCVNYFQEMNTISSDFHSSCLQEVFERIYVIRHSFISYFRQIKGFWQIQVL